MYDMQCDQYNTKCKLFAVTKYNLTCIFMIPYYNMGFEYQSVLMQKRICNIYGASIIVPSRMQET